MIKGLIFLERLLISLIILPEALVPNCQSRKDTRKTMNRRSMQAIQFVLPYHQTPEDLKLLSVEIRQGNLLGTVQIQLRLYIVLHPIFHRLSGLRQQMNYLLF